MENIKEYILTGDCFIGKKGDLISVDWSYHDGNLWTNKTQNKWGCPLSKDEIDLLESVDDLIAASKEANKKIINSLK
jgi:hypothetical protein